MSKKAKHPIIEQFGRRYYRSIHGGVAYYRTQPKHGARFLHRDVWEAAHGSIPPGMEVHHRDHDGTNNAIENLQLMTSSNHARHHLSSAAGIMGRIGGSVRGGAKAEAARTNGAAPCRPGKKRGRPRNVPLDAH